MSQEQQPAPASPAVPPAAAEVPDDPILGIDFGSQKVVVAAYSKARGKLPTIIPNNLSNQATPAVVSFRGRHRFIGEDAVGQLVPNALNSFSGLLQLQGATYEEVHGIPWRAFPVQHADDRAMFEVSYKLGESDQTRFNAAALTVALLRRLRRYAEKALGRDVHKCVLAVPAFFTDRHIKAIVHAAHGAGLRPIAAVSTVVAGAVCYSHLHPPADGTLAKKFLFVDVGHTTTSAAVVEIAPGKVTVLAQEADGKVGSRDLDVALAEKFRAHFLEKHKVDPLGGSATSKAKVTARLLQAAEKAKQTLSTIPETDVDVPSLFNDLDMHLRVSRTSLYEWSRPVFDRMSAIIESALAKASVTAENIDVCEVVGGGARVPEVAVVLNKLLKNKEISRHLDSTAAVAEGAALVAATERGEPISIVGVTPLDSVDEHEELKHIAHPQSEEQDLQNEQRNSEKNQLESLIYKHRGQVQTLKELTADEKKQLQLLMDEAEEWLCNTDEETTIDQFKERRDKFITALSGASKSFAAHLAQLEEKRKQEHLEAMEAEAERSKQPRKSRTDKPKTNTEKIESAQKDKYQGNVCFKEVDYLSAAGKYISALTHFDQMHDISEPQQKEINEVKVSCYLNLAACYLKLGKQEKAIANASSALEIDSKNAKALFRRAQAKIALKKWEDAKTDLVNAAQFDPTSADIKAALANVQKELDAQAAREKQLYSKMFG